MLKRVTATVVVVLEGEIHTLLEVIETGLALANDLRASESVVDDTENDGIVGVVSDVAASRGSHVDRGVVEDVHHDVSLGIHPEILGTGFHGIARISRDARIDGRTDREAREGSLGSGRSGGRVTVNGVIDRIVDPSSAFTDVTRLGATLADDPRESGERDSRLRVSQ